MRMEGQSTSPGQASEQMAWMTTSTLVMIAIGVVLAVIVIIAGARMKRKRKEAEQELRDSGATSTPAGTLGDEDVRGVPQAPGTRPDERAATPLSPPPRPAAAAPHTPEPQTTSDPQPVASAPIAAAPEPDTHPDPEPQPLADEPVAASAAYEAAPAALASDLAMPPATEPEPQEDDLTQMKGVGPKLAARLGELGITRYDQIAALSPSEADALDAQLGTFRGRLQRDRWIEQAGYLAAGDRAGFEAAFGRL
jgi:predicted flap endonuclease-1-like 5' DNA nuclease